MKQWVPPCPPFQCITMKRLSKFMSSCCFVHSCASSLCLTPLSRLLLKVVPVDISQVPRTVVVSLSLLVEVSKVPKPVLHRCLYSWPQVLKQCWITAPSCGPFHSARDMVASLPLLVALGVSKVLRRCCITVHFCGPRCFQGA
jgi:hypothetical protein